CVVDDLHPVAFVHGRPEFGADVGGERRRDACVRVVERGAPDGERRLMREIYDFDLVELLRRVETEARPIAIEWETVRRIAGARIVDGREAMSDDGAHVGAPVCPL